MAHQAITLFIWICLVIGGLTAPLDVHHHVFLQGIMDMDPGVSPLPPGSMLWLWLLVSLATGIVPVGRFVESVCFCIALITVPWKEDRLVYSDTPACTILEFVFGESITIQAVIRAHCYKQLVFVQWKGPLWAGCEQFSCGMYSVLKLPKDWVGRTFVVCLWAWALGRDSSRVSTGSIIFSGALMGRFLRSRRKVVNTEGRRVIQCLRFLTKRVIHTWTQVVATIQSTRLFKLHNLAWCVDGFAVFFFVSCYLGDWGGALFLLVVNVVETMGPPGEPHHVLGWAGTLVGVITLPTGLGVVAMWCGIEMSSHLGSRHRPKRGTRPTRGKQGSPQEGHSDAYRKWSTINRHPALSRTIWRVKFRHASSVARRLMSGSVGLYIRNRSEKLGPYLVRVACSIGLIKEYRPSTGAQPTPPCRPVMVGGAPSTHAGDSDDS